MNVDQNKDGGEVLCKEATRLISPRPVALTWGQHNAAAPITWTIWRIGGKRGEVSWSPTLDSCAYYPKFSLAFQHLEQD